MAHHLVITWGTSRGRNTYGYTTATLRENGEKKAACNGGGYDMRGTVFADWLAHAYQDRLMALAASRRKPFDVLKWNGKEGDESKYDRTDAKRKTSLYGAKYYSKGAGGWGGEKNKPPHVSLDGACGFESMCRIAKACGLTVATIDACKKLDVIVVTDTRKAAP